MQATDLPVRNDNKSVLDQIKVEKIFKAVAVHNYAKDAARNCFPRCIVFYNRIPIDSSWVVGKLEVPVKNKNCQAYLVCSLFFHPLRCPVDLASSSS